MKRKIYAAVLTLGLMFTISACGDQQAVKDTETKNQEDAVSESDEASEEDAAEDTEAADSDSETDAEASDEDSKEEETESEKEKKSFDNGTRLVSVDNVDKYVTIGQYKGLTLDNTVEEISDDDVEATIQQALKDAAEDVSSGSVEEGDTVTIDYVGTIDGKEFDGGQASSYELVIGSGAMLLPGFEDGIIGMEKGESKVLELTFPEDYIQSDLAGQDVKFRITLQSFKRPAELTEEWVTANTDYESIEDYRAGVKSDLQEYANETAHESLIQTAWSSVLASSEVMEYPEADIEEAAAEFEKEIKNYAEQGGMEIEEFLDSQGFSMEDYEEQRQQYAEYKVKQNLIVQGIMDKEGISLEDQECLDIQDNLIVTYGARDLAELIDTYGQTAVDESIGLLRVEDFIIENATIQNKVSANGTVGVSGDGGDSINGTEE